MAKATAASRFFKPARRAKPRRDERAPPSIPSPDMSLLAISSSAVPGARAVASRRASRRVAPRRAIAAPVRASDGGVEAATDGKYHDAAMAARDNCVTSSDLDFGTKYEGKVRDTYVKDNLMLAVTTDRQSAFDRHLASIPFKGAVLNQTSAWWTGAQTEDIVPNAWLSSPDPNVTVMRRCEVFPIEFVVRGYMTGSTSTSLWTHYDPAAETIAETPSTTAMVKIRSSPRTSSPRPPRRKNTTARSLSRTSSPRVG